MPQTPDHYVVLYKEDLGNGYYYHAQSRFNASDSIFLAANPQINPHLGQDPWIIQARNGIYTYQVAEFESMEGTGYASVSVFRNGTRIYHHIARDYIGETKL